MKILSFLPDWVSSGSWNRWGWGGKAAVSVEILYGATPGGVNGSKLTSRLRLLAIKPEHMTFTRVGTFDNGKTDDLKKIWENEKWEKKSTCVTAYWAKDKYSTRTSRPWFSSFKNSLTHLHRDRRQSQVTTATPTVAIMIKNNKRKRKKKKKGKNSKPNMVCAERNLKLSKCLSWFLDPPSELLKTDR